MVGRYRDAVSRFGLRINPNYCYTITVYHLTETATADSWSKSVIHDCSIVSQLLQSVSGENKISTAKTFTVRIPEAVDIAERDIVVLDEVADVITSTFTPNDLLKKYEDLSFIVRGINDNLRYYPPHIKVTS